MPIPKGEHFRPEFDLLATRAARALNFDAIGNPMGWFRCKSVTAQSQDECSLNSWVFVKSPLNVQPYLDPLKSDILLIIYPTG